MIILYVLGIVIAFLVVAVLAVMLFDLGGKALCRFVDWFTRRF